MMYISLIWFFASFITLLIEIATGASLFFLSFVKGGICAGFLAYAKYPLYIQWACFFGVTILSFIIQWYFVKNSTQHSVKNKKTNVYILVGQHAIVTSAITASHAGEIKVGGELWRARTQETEKLTVGDEVQIISVHGAHVMVSKSHKK